MDYLDENELMTIRRRLATGELASLDFGATNPLRPNGLASALARQSAGLGSFRKYDTVPLVAATLFYGLVLNHPFENGNKRTALVAMLVFLQQNRTLLVGASENELYDMATGVAAHSFPLPPGVERDADSEVASIGAWLARRTRALERGDKTMQFKEFRAQLESQGCSFGAPAGNYIKVYRQTADGELSAKMGYPKANFSVGVQDVKRVRGLLKLDETHGFDSGAFYEDELDAVVDGFVNTYRQVLDRLALT
ncbi:type II toxin-antitoxin system death-on-curing family toxin [Labedella populi]|uniref:Type II toxin-antitoxin system death-on-curing family toxin n=1 Tax=Labedella populi TaxID=2498850 RepID=A0A3S4EBU9_9MICO|nr:type II toxin-antitoxin system death-on-curing family toxin [Labedella populi]RWZ67708.1 type II toxin-antitoxin system death-on-curing family toxin [Labedella populi]